MDKLRMKSGWLVLVSVSCVAVVGTAPGATPKEIKEAKCAELSKELGWWVNPKTTSDERIADYEIRIKIAQRLKKDYGIEVDPVRYSQPALWDIEDRARLSREINRAYGTHFNWKTSTVIELKRTREKLSVNPPEVDPVSPPEAAPGHPAAVAAGGEAASSAPAPAAVSALATTTAPVTKAASVATPTSTAPIRDDRLSLLEAENESDMEKWIITRRIKARQGISLDYRRYSLRALKDIELHGLPQNRKV